MTNETSEISKTSKIIKTSETSAIFKPNRASYLTSETSEASVIDKHQVILMLFVCSSASSFVLVAFGLCVFI